MIRCLVGSLSLAALASCAPQSEGASPSPASPHGVTSDPGPRFTIDPGIRVDYASNAAAGVDPVGNVYLYYQDNRTGQQLRAISADGLDFSPGEIPRDWGYDSRSTLLPDGTWRRYQYDPREMAMKSSHSANGFDFVPESGVRYAPQPSDNGTLGVYDAFRDSSGGVVLLYIGDMYGVNNVRRAYSTDNGLTFAFDRGNVLGDEQRGGGPNSYVDPKTILLPDGRRRLFAMTQGGAPPRPPDSGSGEIVSFVSNDDGRTFSLEGTVLTWRDLTEHPVYSLNDPVVVRLLDGRYRMYVTALIPDPAGRYKQVLVSATTPNP